MATEPDKVNSGALGTMVALGVVGMIGTSLAVNALVRAELDEDGDVKASGATTQLQQVVAKHNALLANRGGIEAHMKAVVVDLKRDPRSASPAPTTPPAPAAPVGSPAASPAEGAAAEQVPVAGSAAAPPATEPARAGTGASGGNQGGVRPEPAESPSGNRPQPPTESGGTAQAPAPRQNPAPPLAPE